MPTQHVNSSRLRFKRTIGAFQGLIDSPLNLGVALPGQDMPITLTMLANPLLAISCDVDIDAGDFALEQSGVEYPTPALAADELHRTTLFTNNRVVTVKVGAGAPLDSIVTVHILDNYRRAFVIATGVVLNLG